MPYHFVSTVMGNDEPEADGNEDGHPKENSVWSNEIFTEKDEAWKMNYADSNVFRVRPHQQQSTHLLVSDLHK